MSNHPLYDLWCWLRGHPVGADTDMQEALDQSRQLRQQAMRQVAQESARLEAVLAERDVAARGGE